MRAERFSVEVGGALVVGVLHLPGSGPSACVIACHGMGACKDSDKYLLLGRELPEAGLALARFDFRGSGESGGLYRNATVSSRMADLEAVLDHLRGHEALDGRFGLLGSSLGGFVALWVAAQRGAGIPVVTWNAPASLAELADSRSDDVTAPGAALVAEVREGHRVEAPGGASHLLVVQGEGDDVVPPGHGRLLYERAQEPRELCLLPGADHRLSDPLHRLEAVKRSRDWLTRHLQTDPA
ncbi:MAG TPA: alpha/beta fold hydrolase [Candidatus Bathyarchaeia archaeon]|nr:alpha/beta fold hydrolase [Candidatus Bathyarchaeia archaeon]